MIPQTFHVFKSKEEKDFVCECAEIEYWKTKQNGLFAVLGIVRNQCYKPLSEQKIVSPIFNPETKMLFDRIDKRMKQISCNTKNGVCE